MKIVEARFEDLTLQEYLDFPAWSRSGILSVITGRGGPKAEAADWGTALHLACELSGGAPPEPVPEDMPEAWAEQIRSMPDGWTDQVVAMPKGIRGNAKKDFLEEHKGKTCVPEGSYATICDAFRSMWNHPYVGGLLRKPSVRREQTMIGRDEETGLLIKSRPDLIDGNLLFDVKSAKDAEESAFERSLGEYGYEIQAAIALALWKAITSEDGNYANVVVAKEGFRGFHRVAVYEVGDDWVALGGQRVRDGLTIVEALRLKRPAHDVPVYWTAEPRLLNSPPPWERDRADRVSQYARVLHARGRKAVG